MLLQQFANTHSMRNEILSLKFTAECTLCDEDAPSKRRGQISWVHMLV